jgi:hypothetical protein
LNLFCWWWWDPREPVFGRCLALPGLVESIGPAPCGVCIIHSIPRHTTTSPNACTCLFLLFSSSCCCFHPYIALLSSKRMPAPPKIIVMIISAPSAAHSASVHYDRPLDIESAVPPTPHVLGRSIGIARPIRWPGDGNSAVFVLPRCGDALTGSSDKPSALCVQRSVPGGFLVADGCSRARLLSYPPSSGLERANPNVK